LDRSDDLAQSKDDRSQWNSDFSREKICLHLAKINNLIKLQKTMPRLVGKTSYSGLYTTLGIVAIALGAATALEYFGFIDVVPGFGSGSRAVTQERQYQKSVTPSDGSPNVQRR
jgi:hypothetical protein